MKYRIVLLLLLLLVVVGVYTPATAQVAQDWQYVHYGVEYPFLGMDLRSGPINGQRGAAWSALNVLYDRGAGIRRRDGFRILSNYVPTPTAGIDWVSNYVSPSGDNYYLVRWYFEAQMYIVPQSDLTMSAATRFKPFKYSIGTITSVNTDDDGSSDSVMHVADTTHHLRMRFGAGVDLELSLSGYTNSFDIISIIEDTLLVVESFDTNAEFSTGATIQSEFGYVRDQAVSERLLYLGTSQGLYTFDGQVLAGFDTNSYYGAAIDTVTTWDNNLGEIAFNDVALQWTLDNLISNSDFGGDWKNVIYNANMYICARPQASYDSSLTIPYLAGKYFLCTYKIINAQSYDTTFFRTNGGALQPHTTGDTSAWCAIYPLEFDSSTMITFECDTIIVDSLERSAGKFCGWNVFSPADSSWDSTRFLTGDWFFSTDLEVAGNVEWNAYEFPIVGKVDSSGCFFVLGGPLRENFYEADAGSTITCYAMRKVKRSSAGVDYKLLESYNDRLWAVRQDKPDELRYSPQFYPDSLSAYQTIGINIRNGDEIVAMVPLYGYLYVFTERSGVYQVYFNTVDDAFIKHLDPTLSCNAPNALIEVENNIFVPNQKGFFLFSGGRGREISSSIEPIIRDSIHWDAAKNYMTAAYHDEHIWISYPSGVSEFNNRTLVYHVPTDRWGWCSFVAGDFWKNTDPSDTNQLLAGEWDNNGSLVYFTAMGGDTDPNANYETKVIPMHYDFGWDDFDNVFTEKQVSDYFIDYQSNSQGPIQILCYRSDTLLNTTTITSTDSTLTYKTSHQYVYDNDVIGRQLRFKLNMASTGSETWIDRFAVGVREKKRAP